MLIEKASCAFLWALMLWPGCRALGELGSVDTARLSTSNPKAERGASKLPMPGFPREAVSEQGPVPFRLVGQCFPGYFPCPDYHKEIHLGVSGRRATAGESRRPCRSILSDPKIRPMSLGHLHLDAECVSAVGNSQERTRFSHEAIRRIAG